MDIPLNAKVRCVEGDCGRSTYVIVNPVSRQVTHLVVKESEAPHTERVVPVDWVTDATHDVIHLRCDKARFAGFTPFIETDYLRESLPDFEHLPGGYGGYLLWPIRVPETEKIVQVKHRSIPLGELAIHRGARVEATDGPVGKVDEFLVDPKDGHITHLILREGHLWGQRDVTIPVSEIDRVEEDGVYLTLEKHSIENLPSIPFRSSWI
jgi:sporulation protein YlmC with PRC-barrel domain